ncbi:DNA (cytosine-5-)-methyltransferase [Actinoplanes sp. NBRC 103695]|uniref:DNA cytosine methyltransferase n=1 Tax=Actinoplanes sp. NBRC 103695 TaxID=3032202 RepID=UPI0024A14B29|nr:DNA (cytosine-5-)-methyltransferase [Actinoplanes sp. NBRC 103695]GLZ00197.1 DNA cytosine methyltransferase [Actinoplanes sp. NBRC 103695]
MTSFDVVEICAGAGGQALGLEKAGFEHALAVELDANASQTLKNNRPSWKVETGDVADEAVWKPRAYEGVSLLAGGVPCPPFTIAGKQLGATDERDLFAWAIELVDQVKPRALMLENVRGLSMPRFAGYRQHVLDRLAALEYVGEWRLLQASDFGVPQLRPRFVLVAMNAVDAPYFRWPEPMDPPLTVGETLVDLMGADGWEDASAWAARANRIAPTVVGGSKKHGGADLGPTRAKRAWADMGVDGLGVADNPPQPGASFAVGPKLTCDMVARIQGWSGEYPWEFHGRKTTKYRQIGNAFPPPVARAVGESIARAFRHEGIPQQRVSAEHDPIYTALRDADGFLTANQLSRAVGAAIAAPDLERRISLLSRDFDIQVENGTSGPAYRLGEFKAFVGQDDHNRHEAFLKQRSRIS